MLCDLARCVPSMHSVEAYENVCGSLTQSELTDLVHDAVQRALPLGDARTQAFQRSLALPGAKDQLQYLLTPVFRTYIPDRLFRAWLAYFARARMHETKSQLCSRPECRKQCDVHSDHLMFCALASRAEFLPEIAGTTQLCACRQKRYTGHCVCRRLSFACATHEPHRTLTYLR